VAEAGAAPSVDLRKRYPPFVDDTTSWLHRRGMSKLNAAYDCGAVTGANHANGKSWFPLGSIAYQHRAAGAGNARGNVLFKRANAAVANEKPPSLGGFLS